MHTLWVLIVGAVIGAIAGALTSRGQSISWVANIIAGLVGPFIKEKTPGNWGPRVAGMAIVPSIIGAVILVVVASSFFERRNGQLSK